MLFLPWALSGVVGAALESPKTSPLELPAYFRVRWWTPVALVNRFNNGKQLGPLADSPWWTYVIGGFLFSLPALWGTARAIRARPQRKSEEEKLVLSTRLMVFAGGVPGAAVLAIGSLGLQFHYSYLLLCIGPYYALVASGMTHLPPTWRVIGPVLAISYGLASLRSVYSVPYKENYRDALAHVVRNYQDDHCVAYLPDMVPLQWNIYYPDGPKLTVKSIEDLLSSEGASCAEVWVVAFTRSPTWNVAHETQERQLLRSFEMRSRMSHFWVDVVRYVRSRSSTEAAPLGRRQ